MASVQNERHVIIRRARETRLTFVKQGTTASVGKLKFDFDDLIGRSFGVPYKVDRKRLLPCPTADLEMAEVDNDETEDTKADDETGEMNDGEATATASKTDNNDEQLVSREEVEKMRKDGASGQEIVTKLAMGSTSFRHKTAYAREKYLTKKTKKYSSVVTVYPPSVRLIHEIYYHKDADKIAYLRQDCLAHLLTWSNVHHGCRVAVAEQTLGIVTAAVLDRMAGGGQCVRLHKGATLQSVPCLLAMDFDETTLAPLLPVPLEDFLKSGDDESGNRIKAGTDQMEEGAEKKAANGADEVRTARKEQRAAQKAAGLQILRERKLDSVIVAVKEHPLALMKRLLQRVLPSRPFVVYSPYVQPLLECYQWLREDGKSVNVRLLDNLFRKHQILPGRSHPEMNQPVAAGLLQVEFAVDAVFMLNDEV